MFKTTPITETKSFYLKPYKQKALLTIKEIKHLGAYEEKMQDAIDKELLEALQSNRNLDSILIDHISDTYYPEFKVERVLNKVVYMSNNTGWIYNDLPELCSNYYMYFDKASKDYIIVNYAGQEVDRLILTTLNDNLELRVSTYPTNCCCTLEVKGDIKSVQD